MKRIIFAAFICISVNTIYAQIEFRNSSTGRLMNMEDISGRPLLKKDNPDVTGSPFLNPDWVLAKLLLSKGKEIGPLPVKLNIESNELYFRDSGGKEMIAVEGIVKRVDCINYYSKDSIRYVFKSGYPDIDKQTKNYYYQVLTEGKIELLAKKSRYISVIKDGFTGETTKEFVEGGTVFYLYANNTIQLFRPDKNFINSLLKDKEQLINIFINSNNINYKKIPDAVKLFNYYNNINN